MSIYGWPEDPPDGQQLIRLDAVDTSSWATVGPISDHAQDNYPLRRGGSHRRWNEIKAVYSWWQQAERPQPWRFGLTVDHLGSMSG